MYEIILSIGIVIVFVIVPIIGTTILLRDLKKNLVYGNELDYISNGLTLNFRKLSTNDSAGFYSSLSNWLECAIKEVNTPWLRGGLRFLIEAKAIGFGEEHRHIVETNDEFRFAVMRRSMQLVHSVQSGSPRSMFLDLGDLYYLYYCGTANTASVTQTGTSAPLVIASKALLGASITLGENIIQAEGLITRGLRDLSNLCIEENTGISILALQWAKIRLKEIGKTNKRGQNSFTGALAKCAEDLSKASQYLFSYDLLRLERLILIR